MSVVVFVLVAATFMCGFTDAAGVLVMAVAVVMTAAGIVLVQGVEHQ